MAMEYLPLVPSYKPPFIVGASHDDTEGYRFSIAALRRGNLCHEGAVGKITGKEALERWLAFSSSWSEMEVS